MDLVVRALVVFVVVLAFTRILGKRELSKLQPFDLILLVVIGDLIQQGVTQNDTSVTGVCIVLATIALAQLSVSYLSFRFPRLRPVLDGEPVVLIDNGRVLERNVRRERLVEADLHEAARLQGIDGFDDVRWAVLETSGDITFIKKSS
jgi:uncharacterized membrane protein YcaP (DUF421 family)